MKLAPEPKQPLEEYRRFIREAAPYVSVVIGRRILPEEADKIGEEELVKIALLIDARAEAVQKANRPKR